MKCHQRPACLFGTLEFKSLDNHSNNVIEMFDFCFVAIMQEHGFSKLKLPGSDLDINAIQV